MTTLTKEQLEQIAKAFGLTLLQAEPPVGSLPIRDGYVQKGDTVWWRADAGPVQQIADDSCNRWNNIRNYPNLYSFAKPEIKFEYID